MRFYIVDAFSDKPFGGNTAGVVLLGMNTPFPSDSLMVNIAAQLRYSETAFVQQNSDSGFTVRYFTPKAEVDLCGHATIAAFGVLYNEGIIPNGAVCTNRTLAGDLKVVVKEGLVMMEMATPEILDTKVNVGDLYRIMGGTPMELPVKVVSTGLPDIIMPVRSLEDLASLKPDMEALGNLSSELGVVGVHAFAVSDDGYTAHVRNFAPLYGVPEESATGTANGALTYYLYRQGMVAQGAGLSFMQGEAMQRPSVIETRLMADGLVYVGGTSCIVAKGELLP